MNDDLNMDRDRALTDDERNMDQRDLDQHRADQGYSDQGYADQRSADPNYASDDDKDLGTRGRENQAKGGMTNLGGKIQEAAGKVTGREDWEAEGKAKQMEGDVQKGFGKAESNTDDALDNL